jgi:hypothetical protein
MRLTNERCRCRRRAAGERRLHRRRRRRLGQADKLRASVAPARRSRDAVVIVVVCGGGKLVDIGCDVSFSQRVDSIVVNPCDPKQQRQR